MVDETDETLNKSGLVFGNFVILVVFVLLVGGVYMWVSKKNKTGQQVFPAGINYLSPKGGAAQKPVLLYDFAKLAESSDWVIYEGKLFSYSFQYPKVFTPITYPGDKSDAVTFKVNTLPPEKSLLLRVEAISNRDKSLVGKPKEFVNNYWKFFSGLKSLKTMTEITNEKGLKGYKANYIVKEDNSVTSDFYFFVIEGDSDNLLYIGDIFPTEGKAVFNRLVNSLEYTK